MSYKATQICAFVITGISLLFAYVAQAQELSPGWQAYQVGVATKPTFDFDSQGRIHVMGMTEEFDGLVWYDVADTVAGPWDPQTVATGYFYGPGDLHVDHSDIVHIAYHHHTNVDAAHLRIDDGIVTEFSVPSPGHDGWDNSLSQSPSGQLGMASIDPSGFGAANSLEYAEFDGVDWSVTTIDSGPAMYGFNTSLAYDSQNEPAITFTQAGNWTAPGDLMIARRAAGVWNVSTVVTDGIRGRFSTLAFDASDRPHAAWLDIDEVDTSIGYVRYGVFDNGEWSVETVEQLNHVELNFSGGRKQVSLALDDTGRAHLSYGDKQVVKYATREESGWDSITVAETSSDFFNGLNVLRLNPIDDSPVISYWENSSDPTGAVWLAAPFADLLVGDFDGNGALDCGDIDALTSEIASQAADALFDMTGDGQVDLADRDAWLAAAGDVNLGAGASYQLGDANLDGAVDTADFDIWNANRFTNSAAWCHADFNADGFVDVSDFNAWNVNKFASAVQAVPEPQAVVLLMFGFAGLFLSLRDNRRISR